MSRKSTGLFGLSMLALPLPQYHKPLRSKAVETRRGGGVAPIEKMKMLSMCSVMYLRRGEPRNFMVVETEPPTPTQPRGNKASSTMQSQHLHSLPSGRILQIGTTAIPQYQRNVSVTNFGPDKPVTDELNSETSSMRLVPEALCEDGDVHDRATTQEYENAIALRAPRLTFSSPPKKHC